MFIISHRVVKNCYIIFATRLRYDEIFNDDIIKSVIISSLKISRLKNFEKNCSAVAHIYGQEYSDGFLPRELF